MKNSKTSSLSNLLKVGNVGNNRANPLSGNEQVRSIVENTIKETRDELNKSFVQKLISCGELTNSFTLFALKNRKLIAKPGCKLADHASSLFDEIDHNAIDELLLVVKHPKGYSDLDVMHLAEAFTKIDVINASSASIRTDILFATGKLVLSQRERGIL